MKGDPSILWHQIGRTLWYVQLAEFSLVHYSAAQRHPKKLTPTEVEGIFAKQFKVTVGALVGNLRTDGLLSPEMDIALSCFVDERNWLAHRIRKENHSDIYNEDAFNRLISRLIALEAQGKLISERISDWLEGWAMSRGITKEQLDSEAESIYQQARENGE